LCSAMPIVGSKLEAYARLDKYPVPEFITLLLHDLKQQVSPGVFIIDARLAVR
jgi:hypothetical protein